jgi:glycosyltransferase involved in cell wall biosynthesis
MRILILTRNFPPRSCGVGDYAQRMGETLAAAGNQAVVLTEPAGPSRPASVSIVEHALSGRRDLRGVLAAILEQKPERVQLEYAGYAWGRWGVAWWVNALLFALRRRKIPVHIGLHEAAIRMRENAWQIPVALAQWVHVGLLLAAADSVEVNMLTRVAELGRVFPWWRARLRYRPNSSTIPVVSATAGARAAFRRQHGAGETDAVVATFGMFHSTKNYAALIEAVARVRATRRVKLWMIGDSGMAASGYLAGLREKIGELGIEESVWWSGRLDAGEVSLALQAADVFVLPQADGHLTRSSALMAAAAHGLPVVAVRNPADQIEFTHGKDVWLVERSVPEEIAAGVHALLGDPGRASEMGQALRRLYQARFAWQVTLGAQPPEGAETGATAMEIARAAAAAESSSLAKAER